MKIYPFATIALVALGGGTALFAKPGHTDPPKTAEPVPVIAELFTSEGCNSCPPADALLKKLVETQPVPGAQIIAIGYHVDYWNRLGWRDPFSANEYSQRQENYRVRFRNDQVYTPQLVVNGTADILGSDSERVTRGIAQAAEKTRQSPVKIRITPKEGDWYAVSVEGVPASSRYHLWVATTEEGLWSQVTRGENAGHRLDHVAVVRRLVSVGNKSTANVILPLVPGEKRENSHIVAWVQEGQTGRILNAVQVAR